MVLWREVCIDGWIQYVKEVFYRFYRATGNTTEMAEELLSTGYGLKYRQTRMHERRAVPPAAATSLITAARPRPACVRP